MSRSSVISPSALIFVSMMVCLYATSKAQDQPLAPRQPYLIENARSADDIKAAYPFDIGLISVTGDTLLSTEIFPALDQPVVLLFWLITCYFC
jgi:hypothetical protein